MPSLSYDAVMPSCCQFLSDESNTSGNDLQARAANQYHQIFQSFVRTCLEFISFFSDEVHLVQASGFWFLSWSDVSSRLCRITVIQHKRISYNMAVPVQHTGLWVMQSLRNEPCCKFSVLPCSQMFRKISVYLLYYQWTFANDSVVNTYSIALNRPHLIVLHNI